jgi:HK97 family phage major capsid protein
MNRKSLLAALKKQGYKGKADLAEIQAFLTENGSDADNIIVKGETYKVADVFAKTATLAVEDDETDAPVETKAAEKPAAKSGWSKLSEVEPKGVIGVVKGKDRDYKRYESLIANRANPSANVKQTAVFDTPQDAEAFGAWSRIKLASDLNRSYKAHGEDMDIVRKAGLEFDNSLGGSLVPQEFMANLVWRTEAYGVARRLANVVRMGSDNSVFPRKTGLMTMNYAAGEGAAISDTQNAYDNVELTARKVTGLAYVSNELFEDSAINVSNDYANSVAEAYALLEDQTYFLGDGNATYGGMLGLANALPAGASVSIGNSWAATTTANLQSVMGSVQNVKDGNLAWVCSRQFYFQVLARLDKGLQQFKDLTAINVPFTSGTIAVGNFHGYPVYISQVLPTSGTTTGIKSAYFGDFSGASMIGDRRQLSIETDRSFRFGNDQIAIRATARIAVNVHGDGRGSTVGPIALAATA